MIQLKSSQRNLRRIKFICFQMEMSKWQINDILQLKMIFALFLKSIRKFKRLKTMDLLRIRPLTFAKFKISKKLFKVEQLIVAELCAKLAKRSLLILKAENKRRESKFRF